MNLEIPLKVTIKKLKIDQITFEIKDQTDKKMKHKKKSLDLNTK